MTKILFSTFPRKCYSSFDNGDNLICNHTDRLVSWSKATLERKNRGLIRWLRSIDQGDLSLFEPEYSNLDISKGLGGVE